MSSQDLGANEVFGMWLMITGPISMYFNVSSTSIESFIMGLPLAFTFIFCLELLSEVIE